MLQKAKAHGKFSKPRMVLCTITPINNNQLEKKNLVELKDNENKTTKKTFKINLNLFQKTLCLP